MVHKRFCRHCQKWFLPSLLFCLFAAGAACCYWQPVQFLHRFSQETIVAAEFGIMLLLLVGCGSPVQIFLIPCLCLSSGGLTAALFMESGLPDFHAARACVQWSLAYLPVFFSSALACMRASVNGWDSRRSNGVDTAAYFWFALVLSFCGLALLVFVERYFMFR